MRRVVGLSLIVILLLLAPALVSAQSLFGIGLPWVPSLNGGLLGPKGCGACGEPGLLCCPSVYVGYEIRQSRDRKPLNFGLDFDPAILGTFRLNTDFSDPGGLWLGISEYCQIADRVGVMASGWYLFPTAGDALETYGPELDDIAFDRVWTTNRSWGWIDGALVLGSPCGCNLIAGFRWDSYSVRLRNPRSANPPLLARGTPLDEADLTMNSYIPFFGVQYCCGGPCCGLLVRVVGFPWVPGRLRYGETGFLGEGTRLEAEGNYDRGRFLEVFSEYSRNCGSLGCFGIFARWNYLDVTSHTNPRVLNIQVNDAGLPIRSSWTVGGKFSLNFNMPF